MQGNRQEHVWNVSVRLPCYHFSQPILQSPVSDPLPSPRDASFRPSVPPFPRNAIYELTLYLITASPPLCIQLGSTRPTLGTPKAPQCRERSRMGSARIVITSPAAPGSAALASARRRVFWLIFCVSPCRRVVTFCGRFCCASCFR